VRQAESHLKKHQEIKDAGKEEIKSSQIQQGSWEDRGERHAPKEEGHIAFRSRREGRQSKEQEASHRYWSFGSPQERCPGSQEKGRLEISTGGQEEPVVPRLSSQILRGKGV
jgi:hypothetical protein